MKKRIVSMIMALTMLLSLNVLSVGAASAGLHNFKKAQGYTAGQFADVSADNTFAANVQKAYEYNIMTGSGSDTFGVRDNITRLASLIIACRLHCIYNTGVNNIEDRYTGDSLAQIYTKYAQDNGIFCPLGNIRAKATRAEFAAILSSALPDAALPEINEVLTNSVPDVLGFGNMEYADAIYRLYRAGVVTGSDSKGTFYPNAFITRGAACAIVTRMADASLRKQITLNTRESAAERGGIAVTPASLTVDRESTIIISLMVGELADYTGDNNVDFDNNVQAFFDDSLMRVKWGQAEVWADENGVQILRPVTIVPLADGYTPVRIQLLKYPDVFCDVNVTINGTADTNGALQDDPIRAAMADKWSGKWAFSDATAEKAADNWFIFDFEKMIIYWNYNYGSGGGGSQHQYPLIVVDGNTVEMSQRTDRSVATDRFILNDDGTITRKGLVMGQTWTLVPQDRILGS